MVLSDAFEASRSWSSGFNRIGWGAISTVAAAYGFGLFDKLTALISTEPTSGVVGLAAVAGFFLSANLLGAIAVTLGSLTMRSQVSRKRMVKIYSRVGRINNDLCSQVLADANTKFDLVSGARGSFIFCAMCLMLSWIDIGNNPSVAQHIELKWYAFLFLLIFWAGFMVLLDEAATDTYSFLEEVLTELQDLPLAPNMNVKNGAQANNVDSALQKQSSQEHP